MVKLGIAQERDLTSLQSCHGEEGATRATDEQLGLLIRWMGVLQGNELEAPM